MNRTASALNEAQIQLAERERTVRSLEAKVTEQMHRQEETEASLKTLNLKYTQECEGRRKALSSLRENLESYSTELASLQAHVILTEETASKHQAKLQEQVGRDPFCFRLCAAVGPHAVLEPCRWMMRMKSLWRANES